MYYPMIYNESNIVETDLFASNIGWCPSERYLLVPSSYNLLVSIYASSCGWCVGIAKKIESKNSMWHGILAIGFTFDSSTYI